MKGRHHPDSERERVSVGDVTASSPNPLSPRAQLGEQRWLELYERKRYWIYNCKAACDLEFRVYSWFGDLNPEGWRCPIHQDPLLLVTQSAHRGTIWRQTQAPLILFVRDGPKG